MTPADLACVGAALWGSTWHQPLADARGVSRTTVARWASGMRGIPADLPEWLRTVAAPQRVREIQEAVAAP